MRNVSEWRPTKVRVCGESLRVPANPEELSSGSILVATVAAHWYRDHLRQFARGTLLELGCGKMPYRELYESHVERILATDWPGSLHGAEFVDFYSDLSLGIPLAGASVDTVIAADVLEHIYRPNDLLREIRRVLRPGGTALLNIPFLYWVHEAPHDYFRYTQYALRRMAEETGFTVASLHTFGGRPYVLVDLLAKIIQSVPVVGQPLARLTQRLALKLLGAERQSATFPLMMAIVLRRPESQD